MDAAAKGCSSFSIGDLRPEYWAFISYRHFDNQQSGRQWATWLHQQLESYEVPVDLVGKTNERGDVIPERIFPVFRDEEELPADADLATSIRAAVERSKYMIVLCSLRSAESKYVAEEVAYFKQLGKGDRILAVMIEGEPNASWDIGKQRAGFSPYQECFPKALMHPVGPDGAMDEGVRAEPVAADFRILPGGQQGWTNPAAYREALEAQGTQRTKVIRELVDDYDKRLQLGLNKVLAGALGVPLSTLTQREKAFQLEKARRRARALAAWLSVSTALAVLAAAGGAFGWWQMQEARAQAAEAGRQRDEAVRQRDLAVGRGKVIRENVEWMNFELRDVLKKYAPSATRVEANRRIDELLKAVEPVGPAGGSATAPDLEVMRARMTADLQRAEAILGNAEATPGEALPLYENALRLAEELVKLGPADLDYRRDVSPTYKGLGDLQRRLGNTAKAQEHYEKALAVAEEQVALDSANTEFRRHLSASLQRMGDLQMLLGDTAKAQRYYVRFLAVADELVKLDPANTEFRRHSSASLQRMGDLHIRLGDTVKAQEYYQKSLAVAEQQVKLDPANAVFRRDVSSSYNGLGDLQMQLGDTAKAQGNYEKALALLEEMVKLDPANTELRHDVSRSYNGLGDLQMQLGDTARALGFYEKSLALREEMVKLDPANTGFRRGVAVSHAKLGELREAQGAEGRPAALAHYRKVVEILEGMKAVAVLAPADEGFIAQFRAKVAELE